MSSASLPDHDVIVARLRARELDELAAARRRAAAALRRLIAATVAGDADVGALEALADRLTTLADAVGHGEPASRYAGTGRDPAAVYVTGETHPIGGPGNAVAVPFAFEADERVVRARMRFGPTHEGTPGVVHGGMVAATFDHLLGAAAIRTGRPIVTGTLTVRYRRPTPIGVDLVFEGWPVDVDGRKIRVGGKVTAGGEVTAEADALFVTVDAARYVPGD